MKFHCIFFFTLITNCCWAQKQEQVLPPPPVDARTGLITYSDVTPTPGVTQASLLARAKVWANRISVSTKLPLIVNEMGTDVLVVAVSQQLVPDVLLNTYRLYFLAQVSLREGRYQYRFEEFTFESTGGSITPGEKYLLGDEPASKSERRLSVHVRAQFEQAAGQAAATLREALLTPLAPPLPNGTDW
jgi:hypothetical protein